MMQDNSQNTYSYGGYTQAAPGVVRPRGKLDKIFGARTARRIKSPLVAGAVLMVTGALFVSFITSGTSQNDGSDNLPIVKADAMPFKVAPTEAGGMDIPHRDSTVYSTMREASLDSGNAPLFESLVQQEEPVDKLAAFAKEVEDNDSFVGNGSSNVESLVPSQGGSVAHSAGSSPETLAFVRSVLDRKDQKVSANENEVVAVAEPVSASGAAQAVSSVSETSAQAAQKVSEIIPAAGVDIPQKKVVPTPASSGSYYVQLGSVTSEKGAETEWKRLSNAFAAELSGSDYRVQRADLGERGVYYRIQAGPMSRDMASNVCSSIKAQKAGGCLVTR